MKSHVTARFRRLFAALPEEVQRSARRSYLLWKADPHHPGAQFKRVSPNQPIYSIRAGIGWRAVGLREDDTMIWFWIGPHAAYDDLLNRL